jgi:hypothetical protein
MEAKISRGGLEKDNISDYDEVKSRTTDLALFIFDKPIANLLKEEYFAPKINSSSFKRGDIPINSKLFLIDCNGELCNDADLNPYKHGKGFQNVTINKLNFYQNVNDLVEKYGTYTAVNGQIRTVYALYFTVIQVGVLRPFVIRIRYAYNHIRPKYGVVYDPVLR